MILHLQETSDGLRMNYMLEYQDATIIGMWGTASDEYIKYFESQCYWSMKWFNPPEKTDADALCTYRIRTLMRRAKDEFFFAADVKKEREKINGTACVQVDWIDDGDVCRDNPSLTCDGIPSVFPLSELEDYLDYQVNAIKIVLLKVNDPNDVYKVIRNKDMRIEHDCNNCLRNPLRMFTNDGRLLPINIQKIINQYEYGRDEHIGLPDLPARNIPVVHIANDGQVVQPDPAEPPKN